MSKSLIAVLFGLSTAIGIVCATNADAQDPQPDPRSYGMTPGRAAASTGALTGLTGVIIGVLALRAPGRKSIVALAAGLIAMSLGGFVLASADGGVGTGNGVAGGFVALVLGLIATVLGGLALARSRSTG